MNQDSALTAAELFPGEGEMAGAFQSKDWSGTLLGPVSAWPTELRTAASICLNSNFQIIVAWGPGLVFLYNDAASLIFGARHPWALGRRAADVFPEAWATIGPMLQSVLDSGKATRRDDMLLVFERNGFPEECYFTFSYSPIKTAGGATEGVFITAIETSDRVLADRRRRTLSELAIQGARSAGDGDPLALAAQALAGNLHDLPLAALLLTGADGSMAPAFCTGLTGPAAAGGLPPLAAARLAQYAARCLEAGEPQLLDAAPLLELTGACGAWPEPPLALLGLPLRRARRDAPAGVLLLGANPRVPLDSANCAFLESVAGYVANAAAAFEAIEAERLRVAALAQLERSKSQFFANASHELRTPVTLILGPLGALLEQPDAALAPAVREHVEMAFRNAQRLHKLVNSLMDFASIEAGRLPLVLDAVDPAAITSEIAGLFRSAIEAAGLVLSVRCSCPPGEVLLDRDMWEKIVFNLLSNAFKFTLAGRIDVELARAAGWLTLTVTDTGIGIRAGDIERVFERFYRSPDVAGRTAEGTGVGLALVQELVRLHGGQVAVRSEAGAGTCFTVTVPWRPAAGQARASAGAGAELARRQRRVQFSDEVGYFQQAADAAAPAAPMAGPPGARMRVVVVDDNRDVVRYIERLLQDSCTVVAAHDAAGGLAAVRSASPDLVLVDVMMPGVDGLELVRRIRADNASRTVPVLVLSARAGEEARLDALEAGADDYLVKPFSGRELLARVRSHVQMARLRRAAIEQEGELLRQIAEVQDDLAGVMEGTSDAVVSLDRDLRLLAVNEAAAAAMRRPKAELAGLVVTDVVPGLRGSALEQALRDAAGTGEFVSAEHFHRPSGRWYHVRCYPGRRGVVSFSNDITSRKRAEQALLEAHANLERRVEERTEELREANQLLAAVFDRAPGGIAIIDLAGNIVRVNAAYAKLTGYSEDELRRRPAEGRVDAGDLARARAGQARLLAGEGDSFGVEMRYHRPDGRKIWVSSFVSMIEHAWRGERYFAAISWDITERKRVDAERETSQQELRVLYERLQTVRESERTALAREVHDQLGQILSAAKIDIKLLEDDLRVGKRPMARASIIAELGSASATLERGIGLVREIATELRAPELDEQGLYAALSWHARDFERRTRIGCQLGFEPDRPHPSRPAAAALLRIFQEALTNVLRHAHATQVRVRLDRRGNALVLRVCDDGIGIGRGRLRTGGSLGLQGMRERAELVDGRLLVGPLTPRGTLVSARVPLRHRKGTA